MADKEGKSGDKPNPFLLPASSSAKQKIPASEPSYTQRPFGTVSTSAFTSPRNIFSGSSDVFTSSVKPPVASGPSSGFQTSSFKTFEPGTSFTNVSTRSGGIFGTDGGLSKAGTYTFPVFGEKRERGSSGDGGFTKANTESYQKLGSSSTPITGTLGFSDFSSGQRSDSQNLLYKNNSKPYDTVSKTGPQVKSLPPVFGGIPSSAEASSVVAGHENVKSFSQSAKTVFGGLSDSDTSKTIKSTELPAKKVNVFGGIPSTSSQLSFGSPGMFVTSSNISTSAFSHFHGSGNASETKSLTHMSSVSTIFGGVNAPPSSIPLQSGYSASSASNIFGGKIEGTKRGMVVTSTPNIFGSSSGGTTCFTSVSSTNPRLFGGIPSNALGSGISSTEKKPSVEVESCPPSVAPPVFKLLSNSGNIETKSETSVQGASQIPSLFGGQSAVVAETKSETTMPGLSGTPQIPSLFGGQSAVVTESKSETAMSGAPQIPSLFGGQSVVVTETKSETAMSGAPQIPTLFGGQNTVVTNTLPVSSSFESTGATSQKINTCEGLSKDRPSSCKALFTPAASVFGGVQESKEVKNSFQQLQDTKTNLSTTQEVTLQGNSRESGMVAEQPSRITTKVKKESNTDSKPLEPREIELEPGEIPDLEPGEIDPSSLESKPDDSDVDRGKQLDDLLNIFSKEDSKLTPSPPIISPPQYEKKDLTKVIIAQIPDSCMDKGIIKQHFQKFGTVKRVFLNQKSNQATVQYEDHKGASRAKRKGHKIHPKLPEVKIFYATPVRRKSEDNSTDAMVSKKKAIKTLQQNHPVSDRKSPSDLDPYTPLERPSSGNESPHLKLSKKELIVVGKHSKTPVDEKKMRKLDSQSPFRPHTASPQPVSKIGSPKTARMESPKPALLKAEEKLKTISRPVSPAREYNVFAEMKNLKASLELQAQTSNDRFTVLKARDKLMRNERKKRLDIKKAANLDAGCPDMCPELERYMRDVQNDLSSYEVTSGVLDHKLVVKKFSRSSADKEEPLPHELRPGPVLLKTMDYLVCNIMVLCDKEETDIGVWYNYLWDRTRAIRSDITQQQLTDGLAVTIIERCVRFHIYTAVHLCEESADVFDRKLNTENLTKSLQTLKELYKDLAELGKFFPSETEFRSYEILLNLNDGEKIVHQYSQYRDEVQKSSDVMFALKVFLALKSNNFVKFFKLIRSGTYLQGCILHRYFPQVRSKALDIFVKAYVVSKRVSIPILYIIKTLGFEGRADAENYLNYHGITVEKENVVLDKNLVDLHPEGQPPVSRPVKLIESNRIFSVVEVIQGGPIPDNPLSTYVPHDSFDKNGYLKLDARDATDQQKKLNSLLVGHTQSITVMSKEPSLVPTDEEIMVDIPQKSSVPDLSPTTSHEPEAISDHDYMAFIKDTYSMITTSVVGELSIDIVKKAIESVTKEKLQKMAAKAVCIDIVSECIREEVLSIAKYSYHEVDLEAKEIEMKEKEEAEKKRRETEALNNQVSVVLCKEYVTEFLNCILKQVCHESVGEVESELQLEAHAALMKELPSSLIQEVVNKEIHEISSKVFSEMVVELENNIGKLQQKIRVRKVRECFRKWRKVVLQLRRRKQAQVTFPASCSQLDVFQQNKAFSWGYKRKLSENVTAEQLMKRNLTFTEVSQKTLIRNHLVNSVAWYPLPLEKEIRKVIERVSMTDSIVRHYFKILICNCSNEDFTVMHWIRSKLGGIENVDIRKKLDNSFHFYSRLTGQEYGFVFYEVSSNFLCEDVKKGTSAILFLTHRLTTQDSEYKTMRSWIKANPDVPYHIICEGRSLGEECWELNEDEIMQTETSQKLMDIVLDLWNRHSNRIQVSFSRLDSLVLGFVATHYIQPSVLKQQERSFDRKSPLSPMSYIDLYNSVINYLLEMFQNEQLVKFDWPPPELKHLDQIPSPTWNNEDVKQICSIVNLLRLPAIKVDGLMSWGKLVETLHLYVGQISHPESFSHVLWSQVNILLNRTSEFLESMYHLNFGSLDTEVHVLHLPWTELINACVSFKLSTVPNMTVFYQPTVMRSFVYPKGWSEACDYSDQLWSNFSYTKRGPSSKKHKAEEDLNPKRSKMPSLSSELMSDILKEKEKYLEFQKRLEGTLEGHDIVIEDIERGDQLDFDDCEDLGLEEELIPYSVLSCSIAKEKEKCEQFQKKLESILGEGEDLRFLFKE